MSSPSLVMVSGSTPPLDCSFCEVADMPLAGLAPIRGCDARTAIFSASDPSARICPACSQTIEEGARVRWG